MKITPHVFQEMFWRSQKWFALQKLLNYLSKRKCVSIGINNYILLFSRIFKYCPIVVHKILALCLPEIRSWAEGKRNHKNREAGKSLLYFPRKSYFHFLPCCLREILWSGCKKYLLNIYKKYCCTWAGWKCIIKTEKLTKPCSISFANPTFTFSLVVLDVIEILWPGCKKY